MCRLHSLAASLFYKIVMRLHDAKLFLCFWYVVNNNLHHLHHFFFVCGFDWAVVERIPLPEVFPENEISNNITMASEETDWIPTTIIVIAIVSTLLIV